MADDHNQRGYRSSDVAARGLGATSGPASSGNDPLAELARLIGQNDPFAEYGRNSANRPVSGASGQAAAWPGDPAAYPAEQPAMPGQDAYADPPYGNGGYGRQPFGSSALPADAADLYPVDAHAPGYQSHRYDPVAYSNEPANAYDDAFPPSQEPLHDVHQQFGPATSDDYYDDVAPSGRRISVIAIAGVFALAVIGTAGALGYRAVFGPSSAPATPPVIKADATPSKVVPATANKDPGKSTDRVGNGQIERLLSREEQPVPVATTPNQPSGNIAFPPNSGAGAPTMGSGVVGEPKKVRTISIRPDQSAEAASTVTPAEPVPSTAQPPVRVVNAAPAAEQPVRAAPEPARAAAQPTRSVTPQAAAPAPQAAQPSNAPLSLNPNAAPARPTRVAAQTPAAAPVATASAGGSHAVQLSSQRSEADAQAAFQALQGRFPNQLGGRAPLIRRVDLGAKGIYYRAMVVVGSSGEAGELCSSLKAAGGSCIVQRN